MSVDTEKLKTLAGSASRLVASSAQLAKKQAELATLNSVTLPKLYYAVGKRVARLAELPPELIPFRERIKSLESSVAAGQATESPVVDETATGIAAKAKKAAQDIAKKASQATANAAAQVQIQAAYAACGKEAVQRYGLKAIPKELQADWTTADEQHKKLTEEIAQLQTRNAIGSFTPRHLVLAAGSVAGIVLALFLLRSMSHVVFGNSRIRSDQQASAERAAGPTSGVAQRSPASTGVSAQPSGREAKRSRQRAQQPAGQPTKDPAVQLAIGETSMRYQLRGFKEVELGTHFDAVTRKTPLNWIDPFNQMGFHNSRDRKETFIFNDQGVLICFGKSYQGGIESWAEQLKDVFGPVEKKPVTRVLQQPQFAKTSLFFDYTFPEVLVQIQSVTVARAIGDSSQTHVLVVDRGWAEQMLNTVAPAKRRCLEWMRAAMTPASSKDLSIQSAPALTGATPRATEYRINFYDDRRLARLTRAGEQSNEENRRKAARCCWYGTEISSGPPTIVVQFTNLDEIARSTSLKRNDGKPVPADEEFGFLNAVDKTPCLSDLEQKVNLILTQEFFPPRTDQIRVIQDEGNAYVPDVYEWETDHPTGRWTVRYFSDSHVALVLTDVGKL